MGERKEFTFNAFVNLEPVQRSEDKCNIRKCRSLTTVRGKRTFEFVVVGGGLLETSEDCSTDSYSSQIWSGQ